MNNIPGEEFGVSAIFLKYKIKSALNMLDEPDIKEKYETLLYRERD